MLKEKSIRELSYDLGEAQKVLDVDLQGRILKELDRRNKIIKGVLEENPHLKPIEAYAMGYPEDKTPGVFNEGDSVIIISRGKYDTGGAIGIRADIQAFQPNHKHMAIIKYTTVIGGRVTEGIGVWDTKGLMHIK